MVYCLSRSQPPFFESAWETDDGPDRPVVIEKNRWAERESNPHSQRRLIYSQRSSPHCSICPRRCAASNSTGEVPEAEPREHARLAPTQDEQVVQAQLKALAPLEREVTRCEALRCLPRVEAMVLMHRHPRDESQPREEVHDAIDG